MSIVDLIKLTLKEHRRYVRLQQEARLARKDERRKLYQQNSLQNDLLKAIDVPDLRERWYKAVQSDSKAMLGLVTEAYQQADSWNQTQNLAESIFGIKGLDAERGLSLINRVFILKFANHLTTSLPIEQKSLILERLIEREFPVAPQTLQLPVPEPRSFKPYEKPRTPPRSILRSEPA